VNRREERTPEEQDAGYSAPILKALALHLVVAMMLFVSFTSAPEIEPARPIVQATLVQLNSESPATTPTDQRIAGEAARTAAPRHEAEELQRKQQQAQEQREATQRAEAARQEAAARAEQEKQAAAAAAAAKARAEAEDAAKRQAAEELQRKADAARKLAEEEARKKAAEAEAARKKAAEEAKRKADEAAKAKAAEEAKQRAAAEAARKAEADRAAQQKREAEEARARALAELLADEAQYQQAPADRVGQNVAASYDDVIRRYVSEQWRRPPTARNGMVVEVRISMLPTGQITDVVVSRSSGDAGFDQSAVQAVRNVGRIPEMQQLSREDPATFERMYRQRVLRFKPEDLSF